MNGRGRTAPTVVREAFSAAWPIIVSALVILSATAGNAGEAARDFGSAEVIRLLSSAEPPEPTFPSWLPFGLPKVPDPGGLVEPAVIVGSILVGILVFLALIARAVKQPADVTVVPLAEPPDLVTDVSPYIGETTEGIRMLGFSPVLDFTIPELPQNGFFRLMADRTLENSVLLHEIQQGVRGAPAKRPPITYIEFQSDLNDGTRINTNNAPMKGPLKPRPNLVITFHRTVQDPAVLLDIHRRNTERARSQRGAKIVPQRISDFRWEFSREWHEMMEFQEQAGILKRSPDGRTYQGRLMLMIRHFLPDSLK